ncbi:hypothetical protein E2C01_098202 [Portunus trituberculatus]|uniref:Uncharacterized protein n=1 Tax=Portunus trituberculatus TaxID=210409 RepID=A0A5B7KBI4_PORTR|nr:hypothetical protein [Portunus trituberculatus]
MRWGFRLGALLIPPRKRFQNRFRWLINTSLDSRNRQCAWYSGSRALAVPSLAFAKYLPAALYRFHSEPVLEPVPTVLPAQRTGSLII